MFFSFLLIILGINNSKNLPIAIFHSHIFNVEFVRLTVQHQKLFNL